ncbi:MAG: response regulator [Acidobacteria bacterium]|nr:response regulator [Acidobacteriota bacterium]MBV9474751.1 response regulator [Acidobacteriota bacterium]
MTTAFSDTSRRVLLVDDDELVAGSLRHYLVEHGCQVDVALEARAAQQLLASQSYAVVVVDPFLTGSLHDDSRLLLGIVRERQPQASVIVLTGYGSPDLVRDAGDRNASILTKPQPLVSLGEAVFGALGAGSAASLHVSIPTQGS